MHSTYSSDVHDPTVDFYFSTFPVSGKPIVSRFYCSELFAE
jgi:hypothetical protein